MKRRPELDAARGLMLVWIALTHLPTVISTYSNQPFGFVSASEGFIMLAALFSGRNYLKMAQRQGYPAMSKTAGMRGLKLYAYHVLLLCLAFGVLAPLAVSGRRPGVYNLLDFYFAAPHRALLDAALLIYRPPLLDILPMYILFLVVLTPLALRLGEKFGWKYVLGVSFALWVGAQCGLKEAVYLLLTHVMGMKIPLKNMGAFNLWAWQFLWVGGLWLGARWARNDLPIEKWARKIVWPAAAIALSFFVMRYAVFPNVQPTILGVLFDKWHLGVVRIVDFAAVAAVLIRFNSKLKWTAIRPLVMLGQASLQVFCAHLLFCFGGLALMGTAAVVTGWTEGALMAATLAGMLLTAKIFEKRASGGEGRPQPRVQPLAVGNESAQS
ncbi:MAG TPA: OpgC domain-containing protein [Candidatus Dormibacteraeota bacterium]|nr:OpgC domain-containing protein [Candidatus Dormibacteraeota bacterium]